MICHPRFLVAIAVSIAAVDPVGAVKTAERSPHEEANWQEAVGFFDTLGRAGLPDLRGAKLISLSGGRASGEALPLAWLLPTDVGGESRVVLEETEVTAARLSGRLLLSEVSGRRPPFAVMDEKSRQLPSFDGHLCSAADAVALVRSFTLARGRAKTPEKPEPHDPEVRAFLLAANLQRTGRDVASKQVLGLLRARGDRLGSLYQAARQRLLRASAGRLVEAHVKAPDWIHLHKELTTLLEATPGEAPDRNQLEALVGFSGASCRRPLRRRPKIRATDSGREKACAAPGRRAPRLEPFQSCSLVGRGMAGRG